MTEALFWKARRTLGLLWVLSENKDPFIAVQIAKTVVPYVKALNSKLSERPEIVGLLPKSLPSWPVMKSLHHDFDHAHKPFLKRLEVGANYPFPIGEEARWTASDAVGKWAIHLCHEIAIMQTGHPVDENSADWEKKMETLAPFSNENWQDWWTVAKGLLQAEYVDVVQIPDLANTVKSKIDKKYRSRVRRRIYDALRSKFKSMARQNKT